MFTQMVSSYSDIKVILYISAIGGGVCLLYCLYLVFLRSDATQQEYMYFYGFALVCLIVLAFLLGFLISDLSGTYNAHRNTLTTKAACISDATWQKVPRAIFTESSMDSERSWAIAFLVFVLLMIVVMLYMLFTISSALEKVNRPGQGWVGGQHELV